MINRLITWLKGSLNYLWLVAIALYLSISTVQATVRNYQSQQETKRLEAELVQQEEEKARLEALVVYYQTDSFREKELRQAFLLKKPGERVFALPESSAVKAQEDLEASTEKPDPRRGIPTWQQWVEFLFSKKQA